MIKKKVYYSINKLTFWENLPWQKISLRILMITRQIYIAMKKHELIYVYQLQKYLINCHESKIMLINKILCNLKVYYNNSNQIKLLIKKINKLNLLYSLFIKTSLSYSSFFEQIKQSLIYISLKPVYIAKIAKSIKKFINITQDDHLLNNDNQIYSKFFLTKIVIKKLGCYNYINKSIGKWLYNNVCINLSKMYNLEYVKYITNNKISNLEFDKINLEYLYILFNKIMINDLVWYKFNDIRKNIHFFCVNNDNTRDKFFTLFNIMFKRLFYRKTYKNINKINIFNNKKKLLNYVKLLYLDYYSSFISFISVNFIENCNKMINYFIHILTKKQRKKYQYNYQLKLINQLINRFIYFCNIYDGYQYT
uniref:Reverse transcriptase N-terminal domain-containing protein n=1 Tax=Gredgaria maugeana TaxID=2007213 RepID=A0A1Z1MMR3_9FLOR|nr:hypothetical protein [Gredgaria maugeana]ARW67216.1 hypothetical protein [Gredgaria maugeana]